MKFVAKKLEATEDNSSGAEPWHAQLKNFGLVFGGLALLYLLLGFIADFSVMRISDETEARWFHKFKIGEETSQTPDFDKAKEVFEKLIAHPDLRKLPYSLHYLPGNAPNAFAAPGGGVIVPKGLLMETTNSTALALVLGHELGHHQYRHTLKGIGRKVLVSFAFSAIFGSSSGGIVTKMVDLAEKKHSRKAETEADDFGFRLAYSVYGNAEGYLEFFEEQHMRYKNQHPAWLQFNNTHPATSKRIQHLKALVKELNAK